MVSAADVPTAKDVLLVDESRYGESMRDWHSTLLWGFAWGFVVMVTRAFNYFSTWSVAATVLATGAAAFAIAAYFSSPDRSRAHMPAIVWAACFFVAGLILFGVDPHERVETSRDGYHLVRIVRWRVTIFWLLPTLGAVGGFLAPVLCRQGWRYSIASSAVLGVAFGIGGIISFYAAWLLPHAFSDPFGSVPVIEEIALFLGAFTAGFLGGCLPGGALSRLSRREVEQSG